MSSFQIWFYVFLGLVYVVSQLIKKQKKPEVNVPQREPGPTGQRVEPSKGVPKAMTFEDLLREITESKIPTPPPPSQETVVDYDDVIEEEEQDLEEVDYDHRKDSEAYKTYEDAKKQAFYRPSLEETMKVEDTVVSFGKFKEFERVSETNVASEYIAYFKDMDSLRKAVVMSEILKPKF